jgi:hypothetical protein
MNVELGLRPNSCLSGNILIQFSVQCLCSAVSTRPLCSGCKSASVDICLIVTYQARRIFRDSPGFCSPAIPLGLPRPLYSLHLASSPEESL